MKYSISNIAWDKDKDKEMYLYLNKLEIQGIEIAPTHIFGDNPYTKKTQAIDLKKDLRDKYNLEISSMQSIWFGRKERLFESREERKILLDYTKYAVEFANILECTNLVFGSPKNRVMKCTDDWKIAEEFFCILGDYSYKNNVIIALEANPKIYNTNFLNTTEETAEFVKKLNNKGIQINLDLGTMIQNDESLDNVEKNLDIIHHVHISEPFLAPIQWRQIQRTVMKELKKNGYENYISIEMGNIHEIDKVKNIVEEMIEIGKNYD